MNDMHLFGESDIPDCPDKTNGDFCFLYPKHAIQQPTTALKPKEVFIITRSGLPMHKLKASASWGGTVKLRNCTFERFKPKTRDGKHNTVFGLDEYQSDWTPPITLTDSTFIDVEEDSLAYFMDPDPAWAFIDDCG